MESVHVQEYFQGNIFDESLVLEYVYRAEEQTVILVCDYAHDVVTAILEGEKPPLRNNGEIYHRDLRKLVFYGITDYVRADGPFKELQKYRDNFFLKDHRP